MTSTVTRTVSSTCRAVDPTTCRFHGTVSRTDFESRVIERVAALKSELEGTVSLSRREAAENELRDAEVEYAATLTGEQELREQLASGNWMEQTRLTDQIEEGLELRERLEAAAADRNTVMFPASKLDDAVNRIEKANRKLTRAGLDERFTYTTEPYVEEHADGSRFQMIRMQLNTPSIKENGWEFVASVDKAVDGSTLTRVVPGQELSGFRPNSMLCEHCGSNRHRKTTYLVRDENGQFKQVGSNCLESFLGVKPRGLWALNYDPQEGGNLVDDGGRYHRSNRDRLIPTKDAVAIALAASDGGENFVSNTRAMDWGTESTSSKVSSYIFRTRRDQDEYDVDAYRANAAEMIANTNFDGDGDYVTNMRTLMQQEDITPKQLGMVVSVVGAYKRQQGRAARVVTPRSVGFLAAPGEKVTDVAAKVKTIRSFESNYGYNTTTGHLYVLTTPEGQEVKWSTTSSNEALSEIREGDEVFISAMTVKDHSTFNGNDQTVVKNLKMRKESRGTVEGL